MMSYTKSLLSGSIDGKQIKITSITGSSPTYIHTTPATTASLDEVYLYAYNDSSTTGVLTIQWGGLSEPDDIVRFSVESQAGRVLVADGKLLSNGLSISAYTAVSKSISVDGFVNRITL